MHRAQTIQTLTPITSLTYLHKLIFHNITERKHLINPNGIHLMTNNEFKYYYDTPTKTIQATCESKMVPTCIINPLKPLEVMF